MNVFEPALLAILSWVAAGMVLGALITWLLARRQLMRAEEAHAAALRNRESVARKLDSTVKEQENVIQSQNLVLEELDSLRDEKLRLVSELDQARREALSLGVAMEEDRRSTVKEQENVIQSQNLLLEELDSLRDEKLRLVRELDQARREALSLGVAMEEDRLAGTAKLDELQRTAMKAHDELIGVRADTARTIKRLEVDLAASRESWLRLSAEVDAKRTAADSLCQYYERRLQVLEARNRDLAADLEGERRRAGERVASLQTWVSNLREAYSLACAERDAANRGSVSDRARSEEAERALVRAKADFERQLDAEHLDAADLLSRVWGFIRNYPRRLASRTEPVSTESEQPRDDTAAEIEREVSAWRVNVDEPGLGDSAPSQRERVGDESGEIIANNFRVKVHQVRTEIRKPVSAMQVENGTLVVCDDGSVWAKKANGWIQETPIPGSKSEVARRFSDADLGKLGEAGPAD